MVEFDDEERTIYHALAKNASIEKVIYKGNGIDVIPGSQRMARIDLLNRPGFAGGSNS